MIQAPTSPWTPSTTTDRAAYLAIALTPGIGIGRLHTLLAACCTPRGALEAPFEFLCTIPRISRSAATELARRTLADGERVMAELCRLGAVALLPGDELFPASLQEIPDPPTVLFAQGHLELLSTPAVAIVGSRDHTAYGADVCRMIARAAAGCGVTVVSGMARGLDAVAHRSALEAGGATIGVLGNGLGVIYPAANRELYEAVGGAGLLLTEFPPGERPFPGSFPRRNRLISGLAQVTVVAEAAQGSGALITAGTALDQGRDVMAVPGPITSRTSAGTNALLRDGAEPLLSMEDLLAHFPGAVDTALEPGGRAPSAAGRHAPVTGPTATITSAPPAEPAPVPIPAEFSAVAGCLGRELVHIDAISIVSGQPPGEVLAVLAQLELIGAVEQHPGGLFRRT